MNSDNISDVALQIGEQILGSGNRTRSEELAGIMLAFLTFAKACGMSETEIENLLDSSKAMIGTLSPNSCFDQFQK